MRETDKAAARHDRRSLSKVSAGGAVTLASKPAASNILEVGRHGNRAFGAKKLSGDRGNGPLPFRGIAAHNYFASLTFASVIASYSDRNSCHAFEVSAMLCSPWIPAGLAVLATAAWSAEVRGQEGVPGGWSPRVEFQSFHGLGNSGAAGFIGDGFGSNPLTSPFAIFGELPGQRTLSLAPQFIDRPQVFNSLAPFADSLRKSSRRRSRR